MSAVSHKDFAYIRQLVRKHSAIDLAADKAYLVESRLLTVAHQAGFKSLQQLIATLRACPLDSLHQKVVEAMTTNETSFFRDTHPFEALKATILPALLARRRTGQPLVIWCAACSSGQEPYSIALLIRECFPTILAERAVRIIATDLSNEILIRARAGAYNQLEVSRGLPAALLMKYFDKVGTHWEIKPAIRHMVEFHQHNLADGWSGVAPMDLIFMRNVLIYFDVETKKAILGKARRLLKPDGYLFLGATETTLNLDSEFERIMHGKTVCYQLRGG